MRIFKRISAGILCVLCVASLSFAQADIGFKGIGGKVGLVGPEGGVGSTIGFGALVDLGTITEMIGVGAYVEYWTKSESGVDFNALTVAAMGYYHFPTEGSSLSPYVGAGLGFVRSEAGVNVTLNGFGTVSGSASTTDLSISVAGGVDMELSPKATGRAEFKYNLGGIDYWGVFAGVIFKLGE